ncbi:MAG: hypothetical protein VKL59_25485 [Nostocaceae cyanobacterium]|nr:hypothetical protein [Nostocaceae cyanobacterium]
MIYYLILWVAADNLRQTDVTDRLFCYPTDNLSVTSVTSSVADGDRN